MSDDWDEEIHFRNNAIKGSRKLLIALNRFMGVKSAIRPIKINPPRCPIATIQARVAAYYKIDKKSLVSARRNRRVCRPRQVAMFLARETGASFPMIGRCFNRDHTTVLHACRAISANDQLAAEAEAIRVLLAVKSGDISTISKNLVDENDKEQSVKTQEERLAA